MTYDLKVTKNADEFERFLKKEGKMTVVGLSVEIEDISAYFWYKDKIISTNYARNHGCIHLIYKYVYDALKVIDGLEIVDTQMNNGKFTKDNCEDIYNNHIVDRQSLFYAKQYKGLDNPDDYQNKNFKPLEQDKIIEIDFNDADILVKDSFYHLPYNMLSYKKYHNYFLPKSHIHINSRKKKYLPGFWWGGFINTMLNPKVKYDLASFYVRDKFNKPRNAFYKAEDVFKLVNIIDKINDDILGERYVISSTKPGKNESYEELFKFEEQFPEKEGYVYDELLENVITVSRN